jgi:hypothetical protein
MGSGSLLSRVTVSWPDSFWSARRRKDSFRFWCVREGYTKSKAAAGRQRSYRGDRTAWGCC